MAFNLLPFVAGIDWPPDAPRRRGCRLGIANDRSVGRQRGRPSARRFQMFDPGAQGPPLSLVRMLPPVGPPAGAWCAAVPVGAGRLRPPRSIGQVRGGAMRPGAGRVPGPAAGLEVPATGGGRGPRCLRRQGVVRGPSHLAASCAASSCRPVWAAAKSQAADPFRPPPPWQPYDTT